MPGTDRLDRAPDASTFRRVFAALDADALDTALGTWATTATSPDPGIRRRVAVDGKTLRGSRTGEVSGRRLLAAFDHDTGVVLGQVAVDAKSNEIPTLPVLLTGLDLTGVIVTADALHTQTETARWLISRGAHYILTVKANQCATRRSDVSPPQVGQTRREVCWVRWLTWSRKAKGTRACQETGGRVQMPGTARRGTRAVWRRLDCLNPISSGSNLLRPERHLKPVPVVPGVYWFTPGNLSRRERCPTRAFKEMSGRLQPR
ncbi:ISAs1 family transposase [Frankia sp. Cpl3]|uniref:ISAs1 family transposase n=1 Tax=Parafrankia colletiae TaxID=573497 RepID=UPI001F52AFD8|nr:ISAs1 family transposase [Parafrankia colletiae]MCK9905155.1 ISAs1 family transposase [Frankia sp. Cpl3]